MGKQIVQQPNGKFAIWSNLVDDFTVVDCDINELIEEFCQEEMIKIRERVLNIVSQLKSGGNPYHQLTRSFGECVQWIRDTHGDDAESLKLLGLERSECPGNHTDSSRD